MAGDEEPLLKSENSNTPTKQQDVGSNQDRWWGWVVVLACFFTTFTLDGIGYSFGMFMKPLKQQMDEGSFGVASIGSIQVAIYLSSGPLVAGMVTRFGARPVCIVGSLTAAIGLLGASFSSHLVSLMLCYSLVTGVGFGCMYIPGVVASQAHFTRHRALAVGLAVCGTGIGTLLLPPLVEYVLEVHGWEGAFRALSGLCLASVLCGVAMFPAKSDDDIEEEREESISNIEAENEDEISCSGGWRWILSCMVGKPLASSPTLPLFLMVMLGDFLATMSLYIPYTHLPDIAMTRGVDPEDAAFLISAAGISSTVGRVMAGLLCDQRKLHPMTITLTATTCAAIAAFLLTSCTQYWMFLVLSSVFGLMTGCWVACETPLIIRTLSFELLTPAFGLLTAGGGLAALTGAPLAGYVEDITHEDKQDKGMALVICGVIMTSSAVAYLLASVVRRRLGNRRRNLYQQIG